jgi:carbon-monoxide dehydrogenase large subunit
MTVVIGQPVRRTNDPKLVRGEGRFVADVRLPQTAHGAVLRSPLAHARFRVVDTTAAAALPGVVAVVTAQDIPDVRIPVRVTMRDPSEFTPFLQSPLAREKVRYVGEPIAFVVAEDRYLAEDALALIEVEYEPVDAAVGVEGATRPDAPLLFEDAGTNAAFDYRADVGDVDAAFAEADVVVQARLSVHRHAAVPLETRGLLASYEDERLTVWGPTKVPHLNRITLGQMLGVPIERIRFVEPQVGGGFGARGEFYPEDLLVPLMAMRLRRPVKWIEDRAEALVAQNHSREQVHEARMGLTSDGWIIAFESNFLLSQGAYFRTIGTRVAELTVNNFPGPYRIPNFRAIGKSVLVNKTPAGTYRCPGRFEGNFVRERLIDMAARRLELDPTELRRRNLLAASDMPYHVGTTNLDEPVVFDSGDPGSVFDRALELIDYEHFRAEQAAARAQGRRLGIGIACYMEESGLGGPGNTPGEFARVAVDFEGRVVVYSGVASLGQGLETTLAQICADELDVPYDEISIVQGDTDRVPYGGGTWADRGAILGGSAVLTAACELKQRLREEGAVLLGTAPGNVEVRAGRVHSLSGDERSVAFADVARATFAKGRADTQPAALEATAVYHAQRMCHGPGADIVTIELDEETGVVSIRDHVIVYDIGRMLNPKIVEGQIQGGAVQGIGGVLFEEFAYDENGQPLATSFMDYLLPGVLDVPKRTTIEVLEDHQTSLNPLGIKGAGEVGPAGAGGAIANALADALADVEFDLTDLPLSPDRVCGLLREVPGGASLAGAE